MNLYPLTRDEHRREAMVGLSLANAEMQNLDDPKATDNERTLSAASGTAWYLDAIAHALLALSAES